MASSESSSTTTPASINLHLHPSLQTTSKFLPASENPLPSLIRTPSGLAILELQGTFNTSDTEINPDDIDSAAPSSTSGGTGITELGHITFPDYKPDDDVTGSTGTGTGWMKKVYMFIGNHQRLAGEVKKLPKPLGVVVRRRRRIEENDEEEQEEAGTEDLEVLEVVKYKLVFSSRPEPVTETSAT